VPSIFWISLALLWALVLIQGFALLEMVRQVVDLRQVTEVLRGPRMLPNTVPMGATLPSGPLLRQAHTGAEVDWSTTLGEEATALVLLHPGCGTCHTVAGELRRVAGSQRPAVRIVPLVTAYSAETADEFIKTTNLPVEITLVEIQGSEDSAKPFAKAINLNRKPAVVALIGSRIAGAASVLNGDQVDKFLKEVVSGGGEEGATSTHRFDVATEEATYREVIENV
jgi:hypothetical protein